jgi:hypothetical protein
MQEPDAVEIALNRLMPPALSEGGRLSIEMMLEELAGSDADVEASPVPNEKPVPKRRSFIGFGIAASLAALLALDMHPSIPPPVITGETPPQAVEPHGLVLIGGVNHIQDMADAGWIASPDGMAMEATVVRIIEENTFRDEETGVLVEVSEPREEILLTPISAF